MRQISGWVATHVFGATPPFDYSGASGETVFFLAQTLWLLVFALAATAVWWLVDRSRGEYVTTNRWFRLFIRLGLASQMFEYGMTKVIPTQFEAPSLGVLVTPAGDLSLNTLFWTSVGASPGYQIATGLAELTAGILLLVPRTAILGALMCLVDMVYVFALNMGFDIGLKITTFHLILLALFLLAPDLGRLKNFLLGRPTGPSMQTGPLMATGGANRVALVLQVFLGLYLMGMQALANVNFWYAEGGGAPKSVLYGVWNLETLAIDGQVRPPSENDYDRQWRRVIFDTPGAMAFQRMDDSFSRYGVTIDTETLTLALTKGGSRNWRSVFNFSRPVENRLVLDGEMDGYTIHAELVRVELDTFRLLNSHFRWIRPDDP